MAKVIAVAISKGGVGKTTTAINLAAKFGLNGKKVLLVDTDEQGNATYSATGLSKTEFADKGIFDMIRSFRIVSPKQFVSPTLIPNVDIIPANTLTSQILHQLPILAMQYKRAEYVYLDICLEQIKDDYDLIIIDTPPAKNSLTLSAIYAADGVLIPVKPDKYSMDSLGETVAMIDNINNDEGTNIAIFGILLTMVEKTSLANALREVLFQSEYQPYILDAEIRKGQAVNDSTVIGKPLVMYDKRSNPSIDYQTLYVAVANKLEELQNEENKGE